MFYFFFFRDFERTSAKEIILQDLTFGRVAWFEWNLNSLCFYFSNVEIDLATSMLINGKRMFRKETVGCKWRDIWLHKRFKRAFWSSSTFNIRLINLSIAACPLSLLFDFDHLNKEKQSKIKTKVTLLFKMFYVSWHFTSSIHFMILFILNYICAIQSISYGMIRYTFILLSL